MADLEYAELTNEQDKDSIANKIDQALGGQLTGYGQTFVDAANKYGIDPSLLASISMHETDNGNSHALKSHNNAAGIMNGPDAQQIRKFESIPESIDFAARNLSKNYLSQGLSDVPSIARKYAPVGASNDPRNQNKDWTSGVNSYMAKINATPSTQLPNDLSLATVKTNGLEGISHLTPIGNAENEIDLSSPEDNNQLSNEELSSALDQPQEGATMAMPSSATNARPTGVNADGSVQFDNGMRVYPKDGRVAWDLHGRTFVKTNPYSKMVSVAPPKTSIQRDESGRIFALDPNTGEAKDVTPQNFVPKLDPTIMKNLLERHLNAYLPDGRVMSPREAMTAITEYDKNSGALAPQQQREVQRLTTQAVSSRSLFSQQFVKMYPNYQSVLENVSGKTPDKRNGTDDAFLISAAAGLENPGRSTTGEDFKLLGRTAGASGYFEVMGQRIKAGFGTLIDGANRGDPEAYEKLRGTRILSDAQVKQILDNSARAIKPRYDEYVAGQAPARKRLQQMNLDPDDYLPNLKINAIGAAPAAAPSSTSVLDIEGAKKHLQEHPEDEEVRKALQASGAL